ncbi:MAG: hypothetical protein ABIW32_00080 [Terrimesophilobacter sp.]
MLSAAAVTATTGLFVHIQSVVTPVQEPLRRLIVPLSHGCSPSQWLNPDKEEQQSG